MELRIELKVDGMRYGGTCQVDPRRPPIDTARDVRDFLEANAIVVESLADGDTPDPEVQAAHARVTDEDREALRALAAALRAGLGTAARLEAAVAYVLRTFDPAGTNAALQAWAEKTRSGR
jgi:hypothetical protein